MRSVVVVVLLSLFGGATSARADWLPPLRLDTATIIDAALLIAPTLPAELLSTKTPAVQLPADYAWVERDTRAFWYSAGAAAVTALGTHVLIGIPVLLLTTGVVATLNPGGALPIVTLAVALGIGGAYAFGAAAISALAALLVFNGMSEIYEGDYVTALTANFAGSLVSTAVTTLTFGGGALLFHGMALLSEFTGSAGLTTLQIFTFLGAMPAVVIAGIALIAVPALVTSWALAASAHPREGYEIDDQWLSPTTTALEPRRDPVRGEAHYVVVMPLAFP
jgi:hypothetical protein